MSNLESSQSSVMPRVERDNYIYQYDLDGFPIARVYDVARRMRFKKNKLYKKCPVCKREETLNKPNHHNCSDCLLNHYFYNHQLTEYFTKEIQA